jgi:hypothetical protein
MMTTAWLDTLIEHLGSCWEWHALGLRIGVRYREPVDSQDSWEIWAFPAAQEIVGGQHDGQRSWSGFNFDISRLLEHFQGRHVSLHTATPEHPSELVLGGQFNGEEVLLHICLEPPTDAEAPEWSHATGQDAPMSRQREE